MTRIKDALDAVAEAIYEQKDYLTNLDAKTGDGDHGVNMSRGFAAVQEAVDEMADTTKPGPVLETIGRTLIENVGGAAGPLYGIAFVRAGQACDDDTRLCIKDIEKLLTAAIDAIQKRGRAAKGDKTMLDVLIPLRDCFLPENAEGKKLNDCLLDGLRAVNEGLQYTTTIAARKGRASLIGERGIGYEDPGAASSAVMYRALYRYLRY